jgi:hypothetical protein
LSDKKNVKPSTKRKRGFDQHFIPKHPQTHGHAIAHDVIHVQSPDPASTYIQAGESIHASSNAQEGAKSGTTSVRKHNRERPPSEPLGIEIAWLGMQLKRLGKRGMAIEVGVVDQKGKEGVIRCSSWKVSDARGL